MKSADQISDLKAIEASERDLRHFLSLAETQLEHRLKKAASTQPYSGSMNRMHLLHELIKEQIPRDRTENALGIDAARSPEKNSGSTTRTAR